MKNLFKIIAVLALAMSLFVTKAHAAQYSLNVASASTLYTLAFTNQNYLITEVLVANAGTGPVNVSLFDAEATNTTYVRGTYTNTTIYTTNIVTTFTNYNGWIQTNTNSGTYSFSQSFGAATNNRVKLLTLAVGATNSVDFKPVAGISGGFGLVITNTAGTNVTVTVTYQN